MIKNEINTDAEFKAALMADGDKVLAILDYVYKRDKDAVFTMKGKESDKLKEIYRIQNIAGLITELNNTNKPTAPEFN